MTLKDTSAWYSVDGCLGCACSEVALAVAGAVALEASSSGRAVARQPRGPLSCLPEGGMPAPAAMLRRAEECLRSMQYDPFVGQV